MSMRRTALRVAAILLPMPLLGVGCSDGPRADTRYQLTGVVVGIQASPPESSSRTIASKDSCRR